MPSNLSSLAYSLGGRKVLVLGDLILDVYHFGMPLKDSVEGLLAIRDEREEISYGGAGLLVRHILELGGRVEFISRIGNDRFGKWARNFHHKNLRTLFIEEKGRPSTVKERFVVNDKKVLKWNHLPKRLLATSGEKQIVKFLGKNLRRFDKFVISDYRHGLISRRLARQCVRLCKKHHLPVYVDSQIAQSQGNHKWYAGADLVCLNQREALATDARFSSRNIESGLKRISKILKVPNVIVKLGRLGSAAFCGGKFWQNPAHKVRAVDPTGAGDAFFALLSLAAFPPGKEALLLANIWAGLSTTTTGAASLPKRETFLKFLRTLG